MKRLAFISMFLMILLCLFMIPTFAAVDPEESYICHTCETWWNADDYCFDCYNCINDCTCGQHTHSFGSWYVAKQATCTETGIKRHDCSGCDMYEMMMIPATGHFFNAYHADGNRTCMSAGTVTATCDNGCGATETIANPAGPCDHSYNVGGECIREATCTQPALYRIPCEFGCGTVREEEGSPLAGHSFGEWTIITQPTETTTGQKNRTCTLCGYVEREVIDKLAHVHRYVVPPSGATLSERSKATCTAKATYWKVCSCGDVSKTEYFEAGDLAEHMYLIGEINPSDILPTCYRTGTETKTCTVCNQTITRILPMLDHVWTETTVDGIVKHECTLCHIIKLENVNEDESGNIVYGVINGLFDGATSMYDRVVSGISVNGISLETAIVTCLVFAVIIVAICLVLKVVL